MFIVLLEEDSEISVLGNGREASEFSSVDGGGKESVKGVLEVLVGATNDIDNSLGPHAVTLDPLLVPSLGVDPLDVEEVVVLVSELDELCLGRSMSSMDDLLLLPFVFWEGLVISHLSHDVGDVDSKLCLDLLEAGASVLDGIVEDGGDEGVEVRDSSELRNVVGHSNRMVDVRRAVSLSHLLDVLLGSKVGGLHELAEFHPLSFSLRVDEGR